MKKNYPPEFIQIIDDLLQEEAPAFWDAMDSGAPAAGLRVNPLKTSLEALQGILPGPIRPLPWSDQGIALQEAHELGKHPYHTAGLFYLQEPSAMVPVSILDPQPGERVLDLCAAPGGKTTQIHARMAGKGLLIANDSHPRRVQALARNLERWGARNIAVLCETPRRLGDHLPGYFDRVLVDAPCSGEGRFRSAPGEINHWSPGFIARCCQIQDEILWFAARLVKPGGTLVYSTCTFNQDENEGTLARFLERNQDFSIDPVEPLPAYSPGIQLESAPGLDFSGAVRIWPHKTTGEGHFAARLRRLCSSPSSPPLISPEEALPSPEQSRIYSHFFEKTLKSTPYTREILPGSGGLRCYGNRLYWVPENMPSLAGLNVRHWGWWLGSFQSDTLHPSPALAAALTPEDVQIVLEFPVEDPALSNYLRGSPGSDPRIEGLPEGWTLVACAGHSLGWGVIRRGRLRSYLPGWLRSN